MKKYFLVAFLFCYNCAYQQTFDVRKKQDSLQNLLKKASFDEEKVRLYYELSSYCTSNDEVKLKYYSEVLLKLSQKSKSSLGLGLYHIIQSNLHYFKREFNKSVASSTKACKIFEHTKEDKYYLTAVICCVRSYDRVKEGDSGKILLEANYKRFQQLKDPKLLGDFYYHYGNCFDFNIDRRQTMYYKTALYYYDLCNNIDGKAWLYYRMSNTYKRIKLNAQSLEYLNYAIDLNPSNDIKNILEIEKAKILNKMGEFNEAKELVKKAQDYLIKVNNASTDVYWGSVLAEAKSDFGLKNYQGAIQKCGQVIDNSDKYVTVINALNTLSYCYYNLGKYKKAKECIDKANLLITARKNRTGDLALEEFYKLNSLIEKELGNFTAAWSYNQKYIECLDKTSKKIEKEQFEKHQIDFELVEKENQIRKLNIASLQKNLLVQKQRNYLLVSAIVLFFSIIAFVTFVLFYRTIKKKNIAISENVQKLEKSVKEKELLLKEIHHRVKNNFQLVTSLLNIQAREIDSKDLNEFIDKGQSRITSMALIHENLSQTAQLEKVNFQDYVQDLIENIKKTYQNQNNNINSKIEVVSSNFDVQTAIPLGLIINELYSNILKHAFPNNEGTIIVELIKKDETEFQLTIADDGIGFKDVKKGKKKIGLELVYMLVEQLNGTIELIKDNGTKYIINFKEIVG